MLPMPIISIGDPTFFPQIQALAADVDDMARKFQDFTEPLKFSLSQVILPSIAKNFAVQGRPKWKALAASTIVARRGRTGPILRRTGNLIGSVLSTDNWIISKDMLTIDYTSIPIYGAYHQLGTKRMPARPFIMYQPEDVEKIVEIFAAWTDKIVAQEWSK